MSLPLSLRAEAGLPAALPEDLLPGLKPLLVSAMSQSPTMISANLDVVNAEGTKIQDYANLYPSLGASGYYNYTEAAYSSNVHSRAKTNGPTYSLNANQPLFQWGAYKNQALIGKLAVQMAERQYADAYRTLVLSIRSQYLELIQKKVQVINQTFNTRAAQNYLAVQEAKLRDGRISSGDIIPSRLAVEEASIYSEKARADYDNSRRVLGHLLGMPEVPDESIPADIPKPTFAPETIAAFFDDMKRDDLNGVFMVQYYQDAIRQSDLNYKIAKVRLLPKFNASANLSQTNTTSLDSAGRTPIVQAITTETLFAGGTWSIFDGFATRGAKMSALATRRLAEQRLKTFKETTTDAARALEKQISLSGRLMDLTDTRRALQADAVTKTTNDVKSGVAPQSYLDTVTQSSNAAILTALAARAEFLEDWSSYVSLLGADPALNNLPPRYYHNGK